MLTIALSMLMSVYSDDFFGISDQQVTPECDTFSNRTLQVAVVASAELSAGPLVAVCRSLEAVVLEASSMRQLASFQIEPQLKLRRAFLVNRDRALLLMSDKGELFTCSLPAALQQLARLHYSLRQRAPISGKLHAHPLPIQRSVSHAAVKGRSLLTLDGCGKLSLFRLEFLGEEEDCVQLSAAAVFQMRQRGLQLSREPPKAGLMVSQSGDFVAAFQECSVAVLRMQEASLQMLSEVQRRDRISDVCFLSVPGNDGKTFLAEALGGSVCIRALDQADPIREFELPEPVSAILFDGNRQNLLVCSGHTLSQWSVSDAADPRKTCSTAFWGGCVSWSLAKFPTLVSHSGDLVQLRHRARLSRLERFCSSSVRAEVLSSRKDLFLMDFAPECGMKLINLTTGAAVLYAEVRMLAVHALRPDAGELVTCAAGGVLVFDVKTGFCHPVTNRQDCDAICFCCGGLFAGFRDGTLCFRSSKSSEFVQLVGPQPSGPVRFLLPIDARGELAAFSFGRDGHSVRFWRNLEGDGDPVCRLEMRLPGQAEDPDPMQHETDCVESSTVSPNGRFVAVILPSSEVSSFLVVIDVLSGRCRSQKLWNPRCVRLVERQGATWLLAIQHGDILRAKVDDEDFFQKTDAPFTETALSLDENLRFLTCCGENELIVTSSDAVTFWKLDTDGYLENGRLLVPNSVVAGDLVASYAKEDVLVIITKIETNVDNYLNNLYLFKREHL